MILLSFLATKAALSREHSIGVHFREDSPGVPDAFKHSILKLDHDIFWEIQGNKKELISNLK